MLTIDDGKRIAAGINAALPKDTRLTNFYVVLMVGDDDSTLPLHIIGDGVPPFVTWDIVPPVGDRETYLGHPETPLQ